jgi:hypothetical protein
MPTKPPIIKKVRERERERLKIRGSRKNKGGGK